MTHTVAKSGWDQDFVGRCRRDHVRYESTTLDGDLRPVWIESDTIERSEIDDDAALAESSHGCGPPVSSVLRKEWNVELVGKINLDIRRSQS